MRSSHVSKIVGVLLAWSFAGVAHAQLRQIHHSRTVAQTQADYATQITIPKFDPALGTLVSVGLTARWQAPLVVGIENRDILSPIATSTQISALFQVAPSATMQLITAPSTNLLDALGPFDGTVDFAGPSGVEHEISFDQVEQTSPPTAPADLALFTGLAGNPGTIDIPVTVQVASLVSGGSIMTVFQSFPVGVDVDVSYTYDPSFGLRAFRTNTARAPGRIVENFLVVENTGGAPLTDVEVIESVDPRLFEMRNLEPAGVLDLQRLQALGIVAWRIPSLAPGEVRVLEYRARLDPNTPLGTNIPGGPLWAGFGLFSQWASCHDSALAGAPNCGCLLTCCTGGCVGDACLACRADCVLACPTGVECVRATREALLECFDSAVNALGRHQDDSPAIGPFDPNEKRVGNRPAVRPTETLVYAVHYENKGTLEAIDVFIRDTLDQNLDPTSVQFLSGPPGVVNVATREITWSLLKINLPPGATDSVAFSARPVPNLPDGSRVRNRARIQFETTPAIETNEVENTIDSTAPRGRMSQLAPTTTTEFVPLSWSGEDTFGPGLGAAPEPLRYSVYVAENFGAYRPFLLDTAEIDGIFVGNAGSHYSFYCIARDGAGNEELQSPTAEAFTTVLPSNVSLYCFGDGTAAPCPCGNFSLPGNDEGCLSSIGTGGKLVTSGIASLASDTLRLVGSRMPNSTALYFQGTSTLNQGMGTRLGDGLLCLGGTLVRLMTKSNSAGVSGYPDAGDPRLSERAVLVPGSVMHYQCYYRNSVEFCTSKTFNVSNGVAVTWGP